MNARLVIPTGTLSLAVAQGNSNYRCGRRHPARSQQTRRVIPLIHFQQAGRGLRIQHCVGESPWGLKPGTHRPQIAGASEEDKVSRLEPRCKIPGAGLVRVQIGQLGVRVIAPRQAIASTIPSGAGKPAPGALLSRGRALGAIWVLLTFPAPKARLLAFSGLPGPLAEKVYSGMSMAELPRLF